MKTIGIIGGMGPLATVHLYERIVYKTVAEKDQDHIHVIIDSNTNIPDRTNAIIGNGIDPTKELIKSAKILELSGADFLIMPCNTAHYFIDTIKNNVNIPILNMLEETVIFTKNKFGQDTVVGLLATDGTIQSKIYENYYAKSEIKTIAPKNTQKKVMEFIYDYIKKGNYEQGLELLFEAVEELKEMGADVFVLGCTELSSAEYLYKFKGDFINPMEVLAAKAIEYARGQVKED